MIHKKTKEVPSMVAGDKTILKELLHPKNEEVALKCSIAYASIAPGERSLPHALSSSETYYILEGIGTAYVNDKAQKLEKGDLLYVPPMANQYVVNEGTLPLVFLCIVDPAWTDEGEKIF